MNASTATPRAGLSRLTDYSNPQSVASRFRARRIGPMIQLIERTYARHGCVNILDVGGRRTYWNIVPEDVLERNRAHITILNLPCDLQGQDNDTFTHARGDACDMRQYADNAFHLVHSNSVIEHVGGWPQMKRFAQEVQRVAPSFYVQTPYYWFPIEPHYLAPFIHWLPKPAQVRLIRSFKLGDRGHAANLDDALTKIEDAPRMLDLKTFTLLFPRCRIYKERFLLLTKSLIAVRGLD